MSAPEYQQCRMLGKMVPLGSIFSLTKEYQLDPIHILKGTLDLASFSKRMKGDADSLPERYVPCAYSSRRTMAAFLSHFESTYGSVHLDRLLRHLQVNESVFLKLNDRINILFAMDLAHYLEGLKVSDSLFNEIGIESITATRSSDLGIFCRSARTVDELFERYFHGVPKYLEINGIHTLSRLRGNRCTFEVKSNPDVCDGLGIKKIGHAKLCRVREGISSAVTRYLDLPNAVVREKSCAFHGHAACTFEMDLELPVAAYQKKVKLLGANVLEWSH